MILSMPYDAPSSAGATPRFEAWEVTLDRLELDVILTEKALEDGAFARPLDPWHVPDDYGPIPAALRPRAEQLLERQRLAMRRLTDQLGVTAAHQAYVSRADRTPARATASVYIDSRF
jgi:hypothetical protein